jgi:signal transduction histidine kinase
VASVTQSLERVDDTETLIERLYADETARLVAARFPVLALAFALIFGAAWVLEYVTHPGRAATYAVIFSVQLLACVIGAIVTRHARTKRHGIAAVTVVCCFICALIGSYHALVRGDAEILALALAYLVTGVTVFVPLGGRAQSAVAISAALSYGGAIWFGAKGVSSIAIPALGLASIGALSVAGATLLDRYRYTSFRRAEELGQANTALARANDAKNLFLANVSHELRTPLNVILGYTQLLLDESFGPIVETQREPLERIIGNTQGLVYLIGDLLDLSRIEAGRLTVQLEPVPLAPLVRELTGLVEKALEGKPVRFAVEVPDGLVVTADPDRLRQILVNLLSNAAKFTSEGEIRLSAQASSRDSVQIDVSDTGVGIQVDDLAHLFEPFRRAANAKEFGGVGIGLSISARLARAMGSEITVRSRVREGTCFSLRLPGCS